MASKSSTTILDLGLVLCLLLLLLAGFGGSDLAQDKAECTDKLVQVLSCLPFVSGEAKAPTLDCCNGFKDVLEKSNKCICILIKDRNDPNLGLKINATLAVELPSLCHAPINITNCIDLLHLAPKSKEAKDFQYLAKVAEAYASPPPASSTDSNATIGTDSRNGGRWERRWMMANVYFWITPLFFIIHMVFLV